MTGDAGSTGMTGDAGVTKKDEVQRTKVHVVAADLGEHGNFPQGA